MELSCGVRWTKKNISLPIKVKHESLKCFSLFLWVNHIQFWWTSSNFNELSLCLFMRHSGVNLWTHCPLLCLDLWRWPSLHIYTGMSVDILSAWVNIPPDYCLFAQIRQSGLKLNLQPQPRPLSAAFTSILITLLSWFKNHLSSDRLDHVNEPLSYWWDKALYVLVWSS